MTTQLQAKYSLPDYLMDEICRHLHQLYLADVNQEYHQTWRCLDSRVDGQLMALLYTSNDSRVRVNHRRTAALSMAIYKGIMTLHRESVADLPSKYWYTSGSNRPNGYQ